MIPTGALLDTRIQEEKDKDFLHEELAHGVETPVIWEEKKVYKEYFPYDQFISFSCVAGGGAITEEHFSKLEGVSYTPSRKDIYRRRVNYPNGGMMLHDLFNIGIKGVGSEKDVPSQRLGESDMNKAYPITSEILSNRSKHAFKNWVAVKNFTNVDELARIVDHTPIVCFWYFDNNRAYDEWWNAYPKVVTQNLNLYALNAAHHQASIVDRTLIDGKKYFVVQDTAGLGYGTGQNRNLRFVSPEFIKERLYAAGYGINLEPVEIDKPHVKLVKDLKVGDTNDQVSELQKVLIYEKLLLVPKPTGYFGGMTLKAVKDFQKKYASKILTPSGLKNPTGFVGPATRKCINELYL